MKNDSAQMMVLESIFFAITVVVAITFIYQISPTTVQTNAQVSYNLKGIGDDALDSLYSTKMNVKTGITDSYETNNPTSKLTVCIIINDYKELTESLNKILPKSIMYNIYISNGTKTVFWCAPTTIGPNYYSKSTPQIMNDPVYISHHPIAIDPIFLTDSDYGGFSTGPSDINNSFINVPPGEIPYLGSTYEVILEMSYLLPS